MSTKDLKEKGTHFLLLTGSTLLMAVGTYFFKFTNNFTFGGITGLAVLIAKTGVMSAGDFNLIASMISLCLNYALRSHFPHLDLPFFLILVRPVVEPTLLP